MKKTVVRTICAAGLLTLGSAIQAADSQKPSLSSAEKAVVNRKIATLKLPAERHMAEKWTDAKKMAELICRPAALPILKKQNTGIDRVFLGTDALESLALESNQRLTGSGQYRTPQGWTDFTFTCEVDPESGKVSSFQTVPAAAKP
jgi:hypothetical protein